MVERFRHVHQPDSLVSAVLRWLKCALTHHRLIPVEDTKHLFHSTYSCACGHTWVTRVAWERAYEDALAGQFDGDAA